MNTSIADLNVRDQILISGEDSARFLQGQLTCDVSLISKTVFSFGAVCNTKGRVVANFLICQTDDNGQTFLLETEQGMGALLSSHLSKYAVFYKAKITSVNEQYHRWGIISSDPDALLEPLGLKAPKLQGSQLISGNYLVQKLPDSRDGRQRMELIILPSDDQPPLDLLAGLSVDQWRAIESRAGYPLITADTSEKFTPQELNLDLTGAVSFTKGCYTGQEIIARMHYRGKAKKRLYYFSTIEVPELQDSHKNDLQLVDTSTQSQITDIFNTVLLKDGISGLAILRDEEAGNNFVLRRPGGREIPVIVHALR